MSLNRFYLTQAGWVPEGPLSREQASWPDLIARDVVNSGWQAHDDDATSPPLAPTAWSEAT